MKILWLASDKIADRFWSKVDRSGGPDACWPWLGLTNKGGYGRFFRGRKAGGYILAHRFAYKEATGLDVPDGLCILHKCDNPPCVNDAHFVIGTRVENQQDMVRKSRSARGERNARARLTDQRVVEILALLDSGDWTQAAIAAKFGVTPITVLRIKWGRAWKHVRRTA